MASERKIMRKCHKTMASFPSNCFMCFPVEEVSFEPGISSIVTLRYKDPSKAMCHLHVEIWWRTSDLNDKRNLVPKKAVCAFQGQNLLSRQPWSRYSTFMKLSFFLT